MYIITGAAGFIGSNFIKKLNDEGITNIIAVDDFNKPEKWQNLVDLKFSDIYTKERFFNKIIRGSLTGNVTAMFHFGACSNTMEEDHSFLFKNNYEYSTVLASFCKREQCRFIYASSAATYGLSTNFNDSQDLTTLRPINMYGYSKHLFDLWMYKNNNFKFSIGLKFFNVFGPRENHKGNMKSGVTKLIEQFISEKEFKLFKSDNPKFRHGEQCRDFIYIKDVTNIVFDLHNKLFASPKIGGIYNVGCGHAVTWNQLANSIFHNYHKIVGTQPSIEIPIDYIDMPEKLKGKYQYSTIADIRKLNSIIGEFNFTNVNHAIADYLETFI